MKAFAFRLEGTSMLPLFRAGEVVLVSPLNPVRLSAGDCAVYEYEGRLLLHRAVKTDIGGVWFADDAGRIEPHYVQGASIRGKVVSRNPFAAGLPGLIYSKLKRLLKLGT
jgi:hypothetical protein